MNNKKTENESIILGQKEDEKSDENWSLSIGRAADRNNEEVIVNSATPHVIFICGARGSGKSYTLGVLAEEISQSETDISAILVDPIGIFWSMKYPNQEKEEVELLEEMGLEPHGIENVNVFVPTGHKSEIPEETFDTTFSFKASSLKTEDWCITFGIDRYSPQGLLLERAIERVMSGYTRKLGDRMEEGSRDVPPNEDFSIEDLIECINHDKELLSKEKGYQGSTRRALTSRLKASKEWGIFGKEKKLSDLIKPGKISVIDISFLSENIGSLVLGILARKILSARKASAREEAVGDLKGEERGASSIPPTWLMVDEAHSFAPASGKTAATDPLVEYVKQGRRPGLSAVLSTQQPSALNSKIISQVDILLSHRLSFDKDIKEVRKRIPTTLPDKLKESGSLKRLPEGTAIVTDEETREALFTSIRPRLSQHEGRERVKKSDGEREPVQETKQKTEKKYEQESKSIDYSPTKEEIRVVPFQIDSDKAFEIAISKRERLFKILWYKETVEDISQCYYPFWSTLIDYYPKTDESLNIRLQIDGLSGELIERINGKLERTKGVRKLPDLNRSDNSVLFELLKNKTLSYSDLKESLNKESQIDSSISNLAEMGFIEKKREKNRQILSLNKNINIPHDLSEEGLLAAESIPEREDRRISPEKKKERVIGEERMLKTLKSFGDMEIIKSELYYYPYWIAYLEENERKSRILAIDGVTGIRDEYAERMLRRRISTSSSK